MNEQLDKRMREFVAYHNLPDGEVNGLALAALANEEALSPSERLDLVYFFSVTYCVESAIVMLRERNQIFADPAGYARRNKNRLIFQSDRKYVRMRNTFENCLRFYISCRGRVERLLERAQKYGLNLVTAIPEVESWYFFGRFSAFLFLETLAWLFGLEVKNATIEWKEGNTATSGLLNLFGEDMKAAVFDRMGRLETPVAEMDRRLNIVAARIRESGGNDNVTMIETSLCAYRKFHKASRYNGYYIDRMLEEINKMQADFPQDSNRLKEIRAKILPHEYLGEIGGWNGIRTDLKKYYIKHGEINGIRV